MRTLLFIAALALTGCPDNPKSVEVPRACLEQYQVEMTAQADADAVCDAAFDAIGGNTEDFDKLHAAAWLEPTEGLLEACSDDVDVRVELLSEEQIFRLRCIMKCDGHDEQGC
tara:strand:- start:23 stop:361 length:339 start_codon:yes stop_codon:yes gene_type:complete